MVRIFTCFTLMQGVINTFVKLMHNLIIGFKLWIIFSFSLYERNGLPPKNNIKVRYNISDPLQRFTGLSLT